MPSSPRWSTCFLTQSTFPSGPQTNSLSSVQASYRAMTLSALFNKFVNRVVTHHSVLIVPITLIRRSKQRRACRIRRHSEIPHVVSNTQSFVNVQVFFTLSIDSITIERTNLKTIMSTSVAHNEACSTHVYPFFRFLLPTATHSSAHSNHSMVSRESASQELTASL